MNYKPNLYSLKDKSEYHKKIAATEKKRWCSKHGWRAYWGINPETKEYYDRCYEGKKLNEDCKIGD